MNSRMEQQIALNLPVLVRICRDNSIRKMSLFGSVLGTGFRRSSDIDILVEFDTGCTPGLAFFRLQRELSELLGRTVDLNTPAMLDESFRSGVVESSMVIYAH